MNLTAGGHGRARGEGPERLSAEEGLRGLAGTVADRYSQAPCAGPPDRRSAVLLVPMRAELPDLYSSYSPALCSHRRSQLMATCGDAWRKALSLSFRPAVQGSVVQAGDLNANPPGRVPPSTLFKATFRGAQTDYLK